MDTLKNICDSAKMCVNSMDGGFHPIIKVAETNCADVEIVHTICCTLIHAMIISAIAALILYIIKVIAEGYQRKSAFENEEKRKDNDLKRQIDNQEKIQSSSGSNPSKSDSEIAINKLKELSAIAKSMNGEVSLNEIIEIYEKLKNKE